ncbi:serine hydrolase [uncultured Marivirga sp.]|uniref:serine hydrolase n=1 Tax=uncultured Marivirga sp. TaxID=1123707 RepID=UPI0030EDEDE2|tara:strand:+ start:933 stop:2354 length:1422 start_codon:yes stop_codon:yes gene_type:complete
MKKIMSTILFALITNVSFSQTEKPTYKVVTEAIVKNYNSNNFEVIFSMFSSDMKKAVPQDQIKPFLNDLKKQVGNISKTEFVNYKNGSVAVYKTNFERALYALNISLDANSDINGFAVTPYVEETSSETVINNLFIEANVITENQSELIFENSKAFPNQTQVSIAFIKNGKVRYYGIKKTNDTISTVENYKSIFEIGSVSKVFTSTLLANFVLDGKIKLNSHINDYLEIPFYNDLKITFKELANHTSGLPRLPSNLDLEKVDLENPYKEYKEQELQEYLKNNLELFNTGEYQYSNLGVGLMGYILSEIGNTTYEDLLQAKIFSEYEMQNSTANINKVKGDLVSGINNEGKEIPNWEFSILAGAGGILSTPEDLSKFVVAQFDTSNKALELTRQRTFNINDNMDIGLGWHLLKSQSENIWYWHNGGTGGYSSSVVFDKKTKNGIITLSNVSAFNPNMGNIDKLCFELMKTLEKE